MGSSRVRQRRRLCRVYEPSDRKPITCASDKKKKSRGVRSGFAEGINTGRSCQSSFYYCYYCCAPGSSNRTSFIDRNARRLLLYCSRGFCCGTGITRSAAGHLAPFLFRFFGRPTCPRGKRTFVAGIRPRRVEYKTNNSSSPCAASSECVSSPKASSHGVPLGASCGIRLPVLCPFSSLSTTREKQSTSVFCYVRFDSS